MVEYDGSYSIEDMIADYLNNNPVMEDTTEHEAMMEIMGKSYGCDEPCCDVDADCLACNACDNQVLNEQLDVCEEVCCNDNVCEECDECKEEIPYVEEPYMYNLFEEPLV